VFAWAVTCTWAVGFVVDMFDLKKGWDLPAGSWALMTVVGGGAFVVQAIKGKDD
jgi:hypothetical protein